MNDPVIGTVDEYHETPYEDQSWEILDEIEENPQFNPLDLQIVKTEAQFEHDPMFADYGGRLANEAEKLYHAPSAEATESSVDREADLHAEIERMKAERVQVVEQAKIEALEEGKRLGKEEGIRETLERENTAMDNVRALMTDLFSQVGQAIQLIEKEAVGFSVEVAQKLVGTSVEINPEYIVPIIQEALSNAGTALIQKVRVSPEDLEFIEVVGVRSIIKEFDGNWDFEADSTINSGCVVDTTAGEIDYRLDEVWKRIAEDVVRVRR